MNPSQVAIEMFGDVARLAAIQELRVRLLANKTNAIKDSAYEYHISEVNKKIIEHFTALGSLNQEQADLITKTQTIRNKILHCEFNTAVNRIEMLVGKKVPGPSVQVIKVDQNAGPEKLLEVIFAAQKAIAEGTPGPHHDASKMKDQEVGVFGGLLNCVQTGAMEMAIELFQKSNALLDNLMAIETTISTFKSEK